MTATVEDNVQLNENNVTEDFATPEKQEARAFLRERFLRVITGIVGKQADFHLYENTRVSAEFRGCDVDCLEVYVRNLETPLGIIPEAILRTSDIIHLTVNDINATQ
ncbi:gem-associated protein 7-like [Ceratina calcarata]|uniref:Gem-associated protein 7-like n=1 Tax=Ceratina calcarata TaxID=156304 RepID=A0AAJ7S6X7_9HYME|nr:gem-associated protein 7-like [Ceratina calcarata]XP_026672600.1 gem-associated protein 7-like [Ceratina calcarata]